MADEPKPEQPPTPPPAETEQPPAPLDSEYKAGRPFIFKDPDDLKHRIQSYFDNADPHIEKRFIETGKTNKGDVIVAEREIYTEQIAYTVTGLARSLGVSRDTLRNYRQFKHYPETIDPAIRQELIVSLEDAVQRVEEFNELGLHKPGVSNGIKFNLTNNFGWIDKQVLETNNPEDDLNALDDDPVADRENIAAQAAKALAAETPAPPAEPETPSEPGSPPTE